VTEIYDVGQIFIKSGLKTYNGGAGLGFCSICLFQISAHSLQIHALSQVLRLIACILPTRQSGVGEIRPHSADAFCFVQIC